ncbi:hypothetical protein ACLOJK_034781 [Asimina triloba]
MPTRRHDRGLDERSRPPIMMIITRTSSSSLPTASIAPIVLSMPPIIGSSTRLHTLRPTYAAARMMPLRPPPLGANCSSFRPCHRCQQHVGNIGNVGNSMARPQRTTPTVDNMRIEDAITATVPPPPAIVLSHRL